MLFRVTGQLGSLTKSAPQPTWSFVINLTHSWSQLVPEPELGPRTWTRPQNKLGAPQQRGQPARSHLTEESPIKIPATPPIPGI